MSNNDPVVISELHHNSGIEQLEFMAIDALCDEVVSEGALIVETVRSVLSDEGVAESLAFAFTDSNQAARDAGIHLFLSNIGSNIKKAVEAEAKRRYDALIEQATMADIEDAQ